MAKITIPAANISYEVAEGDTVARAATRAGLGFPYDCNVGECGNCRFELLDGEVTYLRENPPAINDRDVQRKRYISFQALPKGDCQSRCRCATISSANIARRRPWPAARNHRRDA